MKSPVAIAALLAATLALGAAVPTFAQDASSSVAPPPAAGPDHGAGPMGRHMGGPGGMGRMNQMGRFGLIALACSPNGATVLQKVLDRTDKRLKLSSDQETLFSTFSTKALADETTFADACKSNMPDRSAGKPDMLAQMKAGLAIDQARLTALTDVLPSFEALYTSLSDDQKQALLPHHHGWGKGKGKGKGAQPDADASAPDASSSSSASS